MAIDISLSNPTRTQNRRGKDSWYNYYAGYSPAFVEDVLQVLSLKSHALIMDPWNGSGTTTQVAEDYGFGAFGFDINPVMVMVAKARRLDRGVASSLPSLTMDIIQKAKRIRTFPENDPLNEWVLSDGVRTIRSIDIAIQRLLVNREQSDRQGIVMENEHISTLAAFFYVALFGCTRELLKVLRTSNPTWIKRPQRTREIEITRNEFYHLFEQTSNRMAAVMTDSMDNAESGFEKRNSYVDLRVASSENLPVHNKSMDAVITSPPYCTRLDYVIATSPELAILGYDQTDLKELRRKSIGSPVISDELPCAHEAWGTRCRDLLDQIKCHPARASETYYYKTYVQYFNSLHKSIREIDRSLKRDANAVFVIQDSYYKDVHVDLAHILVDMCASMNWKLTDTVDFQKKRSMADINQKSHKYGKKAPLVETVLFFKTS